MRKPSLMVIFLTVFIDLIGFGLVMPLLPLYSERFGANGLMIGIINASFSVMQFLFSPFWGRLSDRIGRRPVILMSLGAGTVSYAIFAIASNMPGAIGMWLLLVSRSFVGMCGGNITVVQAYIADITPAEQRSAKMALIGVAFGLGFVFGPVLGSVSSHWGPAGPGWVATALCGANFLTACLVLPESWKPTSQHVEPRPHWEQWTHTMKQPGVGLLIVLYFMATFCFACYESTLALLAKHILGYQEKQVGLLFAFSGVISIFVQGGLIKRLVAMWGEPKLITISFCFIAVSLCALPFLSSQWLMLAGLAVLSLGASANRPPTFGMISRLTSAHEQGGTLGVAQGAGSLARIFGLVFAATLFDLHRNVPYLVCGVIGLFAALLTWRYLHGFSLSKNNSQATSSG
jgi:MFS transporter, DHA1 family, tetracycline resistance protein